MIVLKFSDFEQIPKVSFLFIIASGKTERQYPVVYDFGRPNETYY